MMVRNAFKGISEMVQRAIDATMPRQAIVTRAEGKGVWVQFTPVNPDMPESYYPANIAGLPAGTAGWVHPLAGGKGRFIADAVPPSPVSFDGFQGGRLTTTSIDGFQYLQMASLNLPAGTYRIFCQATCPVSRNVADGTIAAQVRIDGVDGYAPVVNMGSNSWGPTAANQFFTVACLNTRNVTTDGESPVVIEIGFRGNSTAGTTYLHRPALWGTYQKIG